MKETSLLRTLFPRIPSEKELEARRKENARKIVSMQSDDFSLRTGNYLTNEDIEDMRQRVIKPRLRMRDKIHTVFRRVKK